MICETGADCGDAITPTPLGDLTPEQCRRYFIRHEECLEVAAGIRRRVQFRELNLTGSFDALGRFDVIFCRNVLIYFSQERKREIIMRIARALHPGGHLFLGSTESMSGYQDLFEMRNLHGGLVYRLRS